MSSNSTLDIDALVLPISDVSPSGQSLREHPELSRDFYAVREARNSAMEAERTLARQALMDDNDFAQEPSGYERASLPDWGRVVDLATHLLANQSKDLWIVGWLVEALTREAGIAGLRDGFRLCLEMSHKFWDSIHPRPDDDDGYGHTLAQLIGLDNSLPNALEATRIVPLDSRLTWLNYQLALELEQLSPDVRSARLESGAVPLSDFESAMRRMDRSELISIQAELKETLAVCKEFADGMGELCGKDDSGYPIGPTTANIQKLLNRLLRDFEDMTRGLLNDEEAAAESNDGTGLTEAPSSSGAVGSLSQRPVASRDEALQHLLRVADFFRKTEPHSPVSYALEQAVRWGRMPLPDLLKDLVNDSDVLEQVFKRMGIMQPENSHSDE